MLKQLVIKIRRIRGEVGIWLQVFFVIFAFAVMVFASYIFMSRNEHAHLRASARTALDITFIDTAKITEYAFNLSISEDSYGVLMDSMLNILVHPNREFLSKHLSYTNISEGIIDIINSGEGYLSEIIFTNYLGEKCVLSGRRLENGWYLIIITPEATYYSGVRYIALVLIVIGASMAFILSIILVRLTTERNRAFRKIQEQHRTIVGSISYAGKIQKNLLPSDSAMAEAFSDTSVIWKPRDIVGGDIYWMKQFDTGTVLCVCDCTGHGTPGALLTMLVISTLESIVSFANCDDPADIILRLDQRLSKTMHVDSNDINRRGIMDIKDGCDIAVLYMPKYGAIKFSTGNIPVFICDGKEIALYKGQKLFVGEGKLKTKDEVTVHGIPANPGNKFYIASDGLFDQIGGEARIQFGYKAFKQIILENHNEELSVITGKIWEVFEEYRGDEAQRDDFELIAFKP